MTGRWKAWGTKNRFPPLPPAPWKSRKGEIPTFPPPGIAPRGSVENQTAVSPTPPRSARRRMRLSRSNTKNRPSNVPPERQEKGREAPVRRCLFGIILRWKRKAISVSLLRLENAEGDLRDGLNAGVRRPLDDVEAVRGDAYGGFGVAAAHHKSRGMQADETAIAEAGPIDDQFQVAPEGKRPAAAETDSAGTHVLNRTDSPTGRGLLD